MSRNEMDLHGLAIESSRIHKGTIDYDVPVNAITMMDNGNVTFDYREFSPTKWSHGQLAEFTNIPSKYYRSLLAVNPMLLAKNTNFGLEQAEKAGLSNRTIRTVDEKARAIVSPRFNLGFDGYDMLNHAYPILAKNQLQVIKGNYTDESFYLKAVLPELALDLGAGDWVRAGIMLSTSDVGAGAAKMEAFLEFLACTNGMIGHTQLRRVHIGAKRESESVERLITDETRAKEKDAFFSRFNDVLTASISRQYLETQVEKIKVARSNRLNPRNLTDVVSNAVKVLRAPIGKTEVKSVVDFLAEDRGGLTGYGLMNALTRAAHQVDSISYDASIELERAAGRILDLPANAWQVINNIKEAA